MIADFLNGQRVNWQPNECICYCFFPHRHGITDYNHTVRQINRSDFDKFDFILLMDESNLEDVKEISPESCKAVIKMLGSFDKNASSHRIPDPYYGQDIENFERVYQQCFKCCTGFFTWASAN